MEASVCAGVEDGGEPRQTGGQAAVKGRQSPAKVCAYASESSLQQASRCGRSPALAVTGWKMRTVHKPGPGASHSPGHQRAPDRRQSDGLDPCHAAAGRRCRCRCRCGQAQRQGSRAWAAARWRRWRCLSSRCCRCGQAPAGLLLAADAGSARRLLQQQCCWGPAGLARGCGRSRQSWRQAPASLAGPRGRSAPCAAGAGRCSRQGFFRQHKNCCVSLSSALHLPSEQSTGVEGRKLKNCKEGMQEQGACPPSRVCLCRPDALQHQSSGAHRDGISMLPLAARARPICSSGCLLAGSRLRSTLSPPRRLSAAGSCSSILATLRALLANFPRSERAVVIERRGLGASASCCRLAARNSWLRPPTDLCRSVRLHVCDCTRSRPVEALRSSKPTTRAQGGGDWGNGAASAAAKALANGLISSIEQNWRDCGKGLPE